MVKNGKNRNLIKIDFQPTTNFVVGQKVYKVEKDCLLFGILKTIAQTPLQNNFVSWEGKNCLMPEPIDLLHCAEQFDNKDELLVWLELSDSEWTETYDLAQKTTRSILDCETILDRLKAKNLVLWMSGCWKRFQNLNEEIPVEKSEIVDADFRVEKSEIVDADFRVEKSEIVDADFRVEKSEIVDREINNSGNQVFQRVANLKRAARFALKDPEEIKIFCLDEISIEYQLQSRAGLNLPHVEILRSQIQEGKEFDPVELIKLDDGTIVLYHGFHRFEAHKKEKSEVIRAIVLEGSRDDALLLSLQCNCDNKPQLARSNADKRHSVLIVLNHPEWKDWSDRAIAEICKVSDKTVGKVRAELNGDFPIEEKRKFTNKYGGISQRTMPTKIAQANEDDLAVPPRSFAEINSLDEKYNQQILDDTLIAINSNIDRFSIKQLEFLNSLIGNQLKKMQLSVSSPQPQRSDQS